MQSFNWASISLTVLLSANLTGASEHKNIEPLDEDFLEFIANMSDVDGEIIDTLDMLEIADNDMNTKVSLDNDLNSEKLLNINQNLNNLNSTVEENNP